LLGLWHPDVILRPLTNRFLRGAVQLVGRVVAFIDEGMDGKSMLGEEPKERGRKQSLTMTAASMQPKQPLLLNCVS